MFFYDLNKFLIVQIQNEEVFIGDDKNINHLLEIYL
jgi:hypothetical protein